ncbi:hypothetical protein Tco_1346018 [Tanacetum coccineum]
MDPMASSDPEVKTCSKTCLNNYETLKKQYDDLLAKQLQTKFESATYKRGLDTVEAQLVTYRKNKVLFSEEVDMWYQSGWLLISRMLQAGCQATRFRHHIEAADVDRFIHGQILKPRNWYVGFHRVRIVKSSTLSGSLKQGSHVEARKHKGMWDSTLEDCTAEIKGSVRSAQTPRRTGEAEIGVDNETLDHSHRRRPSDLGASNKSHALSIWEKAWTPVITDTNMVLELADRNDFQTKRKSSLVVTCERLLLQEVVIFPTLLAYGNPSPDRSDCFNILLRHLLLSRDSDFLLLGKKRCGSRRIEKHFRPIHYDKYTNDRSRIKTYTTQKELLVYVYAFEKFTIILIMNKSVVKRTTPHEILFKQEVPKQVVLRWVIASFKEFDFSVIDTLEAENYAADHPLLHL